MKNVTLLLLIAASMRAAINDVRVIGVTPTQAIIAYTAPDNGVCTVEVSESATYSPVVKDVNASLFPESSSDNRAGAITTGRSRIFVAGTRDLQTAGDGLTYSRSLQNDTQHYFRITCGSDVATGDFRTPPPSFGLSTRDPMMLGAPGQLRAPSLSHTDVNQTWTDPYTGSLVKRLSMPGDQKATYGPYTFPRCALGANWNNASPCNALTGGTTSYSGTAQDVLGFQFTAPTWSRTFTSDPPDVDWVLFQFLGNCTGTDCSTAAARVLQACLTYDGDACASPWIDLTLPNSPETQIILCNSAGGATCNLGDIWGAPYTSWGTVSFGDGLVYTSGFSTTLNFTDATDCNRLQVGEQFTILSARDTTVSAKSCGGSPPSITTVSGTTLDPTGTGVAGWPFQYYSGFGYNPRFGVLVRKKSTTHADATLSIKTPQLALGRSASWSFTSAGEHERCNPNLTSHGNILCEPGSADLFSVDPISGTRHYLGLVIANCCGLQGGRGGETIGPGAVLWDNDGVSLYGSFEAFADPTNKFLARFTYTGDDRNDNIPSEAQQYLYAPGTFTVMNPTYINDLVQNCSNVGVVCQSGYDKTLFGCNAEAFLVYRYVVLSCQGQQDTYSWMFIYDLGNKLPVGSGGNGAIIAGFPVYKAGLLTSWGVTHNTNNPHDVAAAMVGVKQANDQVPGNNKFYVTLNTSVSSSTTTFLVTSAWNGAWGTQPAGYQTGDPISDALPGGQHWLQGLAAGDLFRVDDGAGRFEYIRVSTKNSPTNLVVRRSVPWDDCTPPCPSYAWTAGTKLYMYPHRGVIDAGLTRQGLSPLISLRDMEVRSQEPEFRMATL